MRYLYSYISSKHADLVHKYGLFSIQTLSFIDKKRFFELVNNIIKKDTFIKYNLTLNYVDNNLDEFFRIYQIEYGRDRQKMILSKFIFYPLHITSIKNHNFSFLVKVPLHILSPEWRYILYLPPYRKMEVSIDKVRELKDIIDYSFYEKRNVYESSNIYSKIPYLSIIPSNGIISYKNIIIKHL